MDIYLHHSGGLRSDPTASTQHLTVDDIDRAHKKRWPGFISSKGFWVGYTLVITADGKITKTREIGEETAAVKGYNSDSISICIVGNFPTDTPTLPQEKALKSLLANLYKDPRFSFYRTYSHSHVSNTKCYGLPDKWWKDLMIGHYSKVLSLLYKLVDLLRLLKRTPDLRGDDRECDGLI